MLYEYKNKHPKIHDSCFVAPSADIIGEVSIDSDSSIWFNATIRADQHAVSIGKNVSIQDNAVVHVDFEYPVTISDDVVIGHGAIVHGCTVGKNTIIGMGAIVLSGAVVGSNCIIGAGSVVTEGTNIPDNSIAIGSPAKAVKKVTALHLQRIKTNVSIYRVLSADYKKYFLQH